MNNLPNARVQDKTGDPQTTIDHPSVGGHPERESVPASHLEVVEKIPELSPEVKDVGVGYIGDQIKLTSHDKNAGLKEAAETTPVSDVPAELVNLPLNDDQITQAAHQKITDSIRWLAIWCLRQVQIIHYRIRGQQWTPKQPL
ncbi:MAG: hypothetical protein Q8P89_04960 [bacterium]|nr:hypothetical protein [bacterium]